MNLLPAVPRYFKANLHTHTNLSDGVQTPEEVKAAYQKLGYSAVCFTDHEVLLDQRALCDESFVAIHGYEVSAARYLLKPVNTEELQSVFTTLRKKLDEEN